jgi:hypothetical protein
VGLQVDQLSKEELLEVADKLDGWGTSKQAAQSYLEVRNFVVGMWVERPTVYLSLRRVKASIRVSTFRHLIANFLVMKE